MEEKTEKSQSVPALVSIVTPCWNGENFVHRLLDSVLAQNYPAIEMIVVNDGSTDGTDSVLESYKEKFRSRGFVLKTIFQENAGQAVALERGLQEFSGDFLIWTDSDDYFFKNDSVAKFVDFLDKNPEFGFACCNCARERANGEIGRFPPFLEREKFPKNIFERLLTQKIFFTPGRIIVRRSVFLKANPSRTLFHSRQGQNYQMEFPIAYVAKCGFIPETLFCYVERMESHSHSTPYDLERINGLEAVRTETLKRIEMPEAERSRWIKIVRRDATQERIAYFLSGFRRESLRALLAGFGWKYLAIALPYRVARSTGAKIFRKFVTKTSC